MSLLWDYWSRFGSALGNIGVISGSRVILKLVSKVPICRGQSCGICNNNRDQLKKEADYFLLFEKEVVIKYFVSRHGMMIAKE